LELDRINYMIHRYLDYSRIKLGKKIAKIEVIKLIDFVNFVNDFVNFLEYSENIDFNNEVIFENIENNQELKNKNILIDLELFKQLLSNLLDNAYKYSLNKKVLLDLCFNENELLIKIGNLANLQNYNIISEIIKANNDLYLSKGKLGLLIVKEIANILNIKIQIEKQETKETYNKDNSILLHFILVINYY